MMPTAHEVAIAIVSAARAVGADPIETFTFEPASNYDRAARQCASRARAYAARALDRVFNRPDVQVARPVIAKMVGVSAASKGAYFSSLDQRPLPWWDDAVLKLVVNAVMDFEPSPAQNPSPHPFKAGPLSPVRKPAEPARPAAHGPPRTKLDAFAPASGKPRPFDAGGDEQLQKRALERRRCGDLLAEAAANTAKLQAKLPED